MNLKKKKIYIILYIVKKFKRKSHMISNKKYILLNIDWNLKAIYQRVINDLKSPIGNSHELKIKMIIYKIILKIL